MKKVLLVYHGFSEVLGGGEFLPLLFIAELQKACEVTLAVKWTSDLDKVAKLYAVPIDVAKLKVVVVRPKSELLKRLDAKFPFYQVHQLKKLARDADVCISCENTRDFGKPAHHFIFSLLGYFWDKSFVDFCHHVPPKRGIALLWEKMRRALGDRVIRPLFGIRSTRRILANPNERIYPNSQYVERSMRQFYGPLHSKVFYPPTMFECRTQGERDALRIVYLGRIAPEKRILEMVEIIKAVRKVTGLELTYHLAGMSKAGQTIAEQLRQIAQDNPWMKLVGQLNGVAKEEFLLGGTYALHAERDETFGISVTEYLKAGVIPIVPDDGGTPEIVNSPALTFHTNEEAIRILARLLTDSVFREEQRRHCAERAKFFSREAYLQRQRKLLQDILAES